MEWINSIWNWILENQSNITTFVSSSSFVAICGLLASIIRSNKNVKDNTLSIQTVNKSVAASQVIKDDVDNVNNSVLVLNDNVLDCITQVKLCTDAVNKITEVFDEYCNELMAKTNAMVEVQNIVYSTIKDDAVRTAVNTVLLNAKYSDNGSKLKLQEEVAALKEEISSKNEELNKALAAMVERVSSEVPNTPTRY